jgi:pimeloyl-ACP methyl ester carboxylesterase
MQNNSIRLPSKRCRSVYDRLVFESGCAVFEMGFWFLDKRSAARVDAAKVTCSTLVVAGGDDRMKQCTVVERVAARYRSVSTYHVFAEHGHWAVGEPGWQDIARFVLAWLEIHAPPGRTATAASAARPECLPPSTEWKLIST